MAWLIESFLNEGKQGPDHPESLGMKNKQDFNVKKYKEENTDKAIETHNANARTLRKAIADGDVKQSDVDKMNSCFIPDMKKGTKAVNKGAKKYFQDNEAKSLWKKLWLIPMENHGDMIKNGKFVKTK